MDVVVVLVNVISCSNSFALVSNVLRCLPAVYLCYYFDIRDCLCAFSWI